MAADNGFAHLNFLPLKGRNNLLDRLFYDVGSLTKEEQADLSPLTDREGTVLLVCPSRAGKKILHYRNALQLFLRSGSEVEGIAIAGVGSSVLGTAALARNVAEAIGGPVAGIVSGYGLTDLMAEALGGWFFFGAIDRGKYKTEARIAELLHGSKEGTPGAANALLDGLPLQADTSALLDLLEAAPPKLRYLVGHSKGCLQIDYVLERYVRGRAGVPSELYDRLEVVTLGAVVNLPPAFKKVTQVIGTIDSFGKLNSSPTARRFEVPGAWHHLNRNKPAHLDAVAVMRSIVEGKPIGTEVSNPADRLPHFPLSLASFGSEGRTGRRRVRRSPRSGTPGGTSVRQADHADDAKPCPPAASGASPEPIPGHPPGPRRGHVSRAIGEGGAPWTMAAATLAQPGRAPSPTRPGPPPCLGRDPWRTRD